MLSNHNSNAFKSAFSTFRFTLSFLSFLLMLSFVFLQVSANACVTPRLFTRHLSAQASGERGRSLVLTAIREDGAKRRAGPGHGTWAPSPRGSRMELPFHRRHPKLSFLFLNLKGHGLNPLQTEDTCILNFISSNTRFKEKSIFLRPTTFRRAPPTVNWR